MSRSAREKGTGATGAIWVVNCELGNKLDCGVANGVWNPKPPADGVCCWSNGVCCAWVWAEYGVESNEPKPPVAKDGVDGVPNAGVDDGVPKAGVDDGAPKAGVDDSAPKAGVEDCAPKAGVEYGAPKAGVEEGVPKAGVEEAPKAGVEEGVPKAGAEEGVPKAGAEVWDPNIFARSRCWSGKMEDWNPQASARFNFLKRDSTDLFVSKFDGAWRFSSFLLYGPYLNWALNWAICMNFEVQFSFFRFFVSFFLFFFLFL